jgi:hypothetical protein
MPFILRKRSTGSFHFKGESYVHGIMDGEFLLKLRDDSGSSRAEVKDETGLIRSVTGLCPSKQRQ